MAGQPSARRDSAELQASREAAGIVWELGAVLPPEVVAKIYAETMLELGQAAGLIPKVGAMPAAPRSSEAPGSSADMGQ